MAFLLRLQTYNKIATLMSSADVFPCKDRVLRAFIIASGSLTHQSQTDTSCQEGDKI